MNSAPAALITHRLEYVVDPGEAIMHAGIEWRHAGSGGWPQTGLYSMVQYAVVPTCTEAVAFASLPDSSRTMIRTVYEPAFEYECVNEVVCWMDVVGGNELIAVSRTAHSSPHCTEYVRRPFSGSVAFISHVPTSFRLSEVGPEKPEIEGGRLLLSLRHTPSCTKVALSASIMHLLLYVCWIGSHGAVMHTIGFEPQTGLYSFIHPTFAPT